MHGFLVHHSFHLFSIRSSARFMQLYWSSVQGKIPQVVTRFYLSPHSPPTFEVVLTRFGRFHLMYLFAINQALPYGCSFLTYGHPGVSEAGDITIIWNDVLN